MRTIIQSIIAILLAFFTTLIELNAEQRVINVTNRALLITLNIEREEQVRDWSSESRGLHARPRDPRREVFPEQYQVSLEPGESHIVRPWESSQIRREIVNLSVLMPQIPLIPETRMDIGTNDRLLVFFLARNSLSLLRLNSEDQLQDVIH